MTEVYYFFKAQGIANQTVEDVEIYLDKPVPDFDTLEKADKLYDWQATGIERILHDTLPGGVYDRLLSKMLERKISHFRVSYKE